MLWPTVRLVQPVLMEELFFMSCATVMPFLAAMVVQTSPTLTVYVVPAGLVEGGAGALREGAGALLATGRAAELLAAGGAAGLLAAGGGDAGLLAAGGGTAGLLAAGGAGSAGEGGAGAEGAEGPEEPQVPVGAPSLAWLITCKSAPGLGNLTSVPSGTAHPLPTLATIMSGLSARVEVPLPVMVTAAQFMYISRLPVLLNHVQEKMASPDFASVGTVKSNVWSPPAGFTQPPSIDLMTLNVLPPSYESES